MLVKPLVRPIVRAIAGNPTASLGSGFSPTSLFLDGSKGVVYDNNDFVDSATWRRNLLTYSEQFDNAAWTKSAATITANTAVAPDGTTTADKAVATAAAGFHGIYQSVSQIVTSYTYSVYAKAAEYSKLQLANGSSGTWSATFDLATGATIATGGTAVLSSNIQSAGDGWFRCSVTFTGSVAFTAHSVIGYPDAGATLNNFGASYTGDGTSGVLVWGAQLETGSTATTYQRITDFNSDFLAAFPSTTLFLDAAGTTPATVNGLVGLQLDKSANLALGAELVTNGGFDSDVSGWTAGGSATTSYSSGRLRVTGTAASLPGSGYQAITTVVGRWYKVEADCFYVSGTVDTAIQARTDASPTGGTLLANYTVGSNASGNASLVFLATGTTTYIHGRLTGSTISLGSTLEFDNISVKELPGNHRYQTTTGSKPVLRGTPTGSNLVTNGDFATDTAWTKVGNATISGGTGNLDGNGAAGNVLLYQNAGLVTGRVYRATFTITAITGTLNVWDNGGAALATYTTTGTKEFYFTHNNASGNFLFRVAVGANTASVDNVSVFDVSAGQVTAPYGLQYDGVDDFLQTAAVDFTATDKMFVCAGVRKLSDAALGILVELSPNLFLNNGSFVVNAPNSAGANYGLFSKGTTIAGVASSGFASPVTNVLSAIGGISTDTCILRVNGAQVGADTTDQGTGNYGNYALYFGRRAGTAAPYNGLDFGYVICGKTLTSTQIANTERWMSYRTGVTL